MEFCHHCGARDGTRHELALTTNSAHAPNVPGYVKSRPRVSGIHVHAIAPSR